LLLLFLEVLILILVFIIIILIVVVLVVHRMYHFPSPTAKEIVSRNIKNLAIFCLLLPSPLCIVKAQIDMSPRFLQLCKFHFNYILPRRDHVQQRLE